MPDAPSQSPSQSSMPVTALRYFARQLTPMQGKSLLAAIVATVGGFVGAVYGWIGGRADASAASGEGAWAGWASNQAVGWGLSFIAAFVIFFFVRRFLFRAMGILLLVFAAAGTVSYFSGIDIDLSRARTAYDQSAGWVSRQADALLDTIKRNFGGAAAAGLGAFMGGRKPK